MITQKQVEDVICNLFKQAVINLSSDVVKALDEAYKRKNRILPDKFRGNIKEYQCSP